jgi:hypothetical protein
MHMRVADVGRNVSSMENLNINLEVEKRLLGTCMF